MYKESEVQKETLKYFKQDELATRVWIKKYALKNQKDELLEKTPDDMHRRLAKEYFRIENNYPNPLSEEEIYELLKDFTYLVPGGSQLSGIGNPFQIISLSNCFVVDSPKDSYGGIMLIDQEQVQIMKRRGGVGHDQSNLRPEGTLANNALLRGGAGSTLYMDRYSHSTREVSQGDRRGALMLSTSIKHPDSDKFIDAKLEEGKVTGANISVRVSDEFMEAASKSKQTFWQTFPVDLKIPIGKEYDDVLTKLELNKLTELPNKIGYIKEVDPQKLLNKIAQNAWKSAEPGLLFWDRIINESPAGCYGESWKETSTNPCFTGDTLILTENGYLTFYELQKNNQNYINFINENNEKVQGKVWSNGYKSVIKLIFDNEKFIECTPDHIFKLIDNSACEARKLIGKIVKGLDNNNSRVIKIEISGVKEVFDFNLNSENHWGVVGDGLIAHNCGEIPLCPYDSCRLLAINLFSYVEHPFESNAFFNLTLFKEHVRKAQRIMDDLVDLEIEAIQKIINKIISDPEDFDTKKVEYDLWVKILDKAIQGRRTGLGITAEGDMLAALGFRYGTPEATEYATSIHLIMAKESYSSSIQLAKERGSFPIWDINKEEMNPFINRVLAEFNDGWAFEKGQDNPILCEYEKYGRRNIANLTIAPTGSLSVMTQTTSGVEPCIFPYYFRRRKTYGEGKVDFIDEMGDKWEEFAVIHHGLKMWYDKNWFKIWPKNFDIDFHKDIEDLTKDELQQVYEKSPYYKATSSDVDWRESVRMQGSIQKWIDHSISKTINLPKTATVEDVKELYELAWKSGCKGVTVYRDGSRNGVIIQNKENKSVFKYNDSVKRPETVECDIYHKIVLKQDRMILVGLVNGLPYEIFAFEDPGNNVFPRKIEKGTLTKVKSRTYKLEGILCNKKYTINNVVELMSNDDRVDTRKYSSMLRHGMAPKFIVDQIEEYATIVSFDKVIQRTLRNYISPEDQKEESCPLCESKLIREEGCVKCTSCEYSKCG